MPKLGANLTEQGESRGRLPESNADVIAKAALGVLVLGVLVAAPSAAASPAKAGPPVVNLDAVPPVDTSQHSVPIRDVVFDTFNGGFLRLNEARSPDIRRLRDAIKPIYRPRYGTERELPWLLGSDLVIGFSSRRGAYAYPLKVLNFRELVNDVIDGVPVLVSYCPLCGSGVVYSRTIDGRTLLFGNTSALYQSDLVMYDHETGSYWFQVQGEAIVGKLTGKRLKALPSATLTWAEWKRLHPDTRLLVGDAGAPFSFQYAQDPFLGYSQSLDAGRFPFPVSKDKLDGRLRASEIVLTAEVNAARKAYPLRLIGNAAVNDAIGDAPVVVFSRDGSGFAYRATVERRRLTFALKGDAFVDRETGSSWNAAGQALSGRLKGSRLEPLPSRRAFWFSIAIANPGIALYLPPKRG